MSTIWVFDNIENKHTLYCEEDCLKTFYTSLREDATNVINFEKKKKMLPLTEKELKLHQDATECYICGKYSQKSLLMIKISRNIESIAIIQVNIEVQHIVFVI